jgi:hypothetical protein
MSTPKGPLYVRNEAGDLFNPGTNKEYQTPVWEYVRLESGEDMLVGPASLTVDRTATARLASGDNGSIQQGHGS